MPVQQSDIVKVADAVVSALNASVAPKPSIFFGYRNAERSYTATYELEDSDLGNKSNRFVRVVVVPFGDEGTLDTRATSNHLYTIRLVILAPLEDKDREHIDVLVKYTQDVADYFRFGRTPGGASLTSARTTVVFVPEDIEGKRQFTSVVTLTFRGWRERT